METVGQIFQKRNETTISSTTENKIQKYFNQPKIHFVGFWYYNNIPHHNDSFIQLKVCQSSSKPNNKDVLDKLKRIQEVAGVKQYIGYSKCRLCHKNNYANEYFIDYFVFPRGYLHYLEHHNVQIEPEFEEFIINFNFNKEHNTTFQYSYL